jgi:aconitate hydratase A / 2-methylisocitrate dehydratase
VSIREQDQLTSFTCGGRSYRRVDVSALAGTCGRRLPYSLRVVAENLCLSGASPQALQAVLDWSAASPALTVPLAVSRVILPDSSGLPALMDIAALRTELAGAGRDPTPVEPIIPVDLIVDHSLIVDRAGSRDAYEFNVRREFQRNGERYAFFKWAQQAFKGLRVVPPGMGIIHQVHLEYLAQVVAVGRDGPQPTVSAEFVLGCDSHTPMINGLGVLGWGVGGIDAEAAMVGEPYSVTIPKVVGVRLTGRLASGTTTTDLVLTITELLRKHGVVGAFVEFAGPALDQLTVPDRATIANMAPEYGATCGYFPIDQQTLSYLRATGRAETHVRLIEDYATAAGLFRKAGEAEPEFSELIVVDLARIVPSVSGPRRPQQRVALPQVKDSFRTLLSAPVSDGGFAVENAEAEISLVAAGETHRVGHGVLAIAAITSCTNTSNPSVMIAAGLLARNAAARGLSKRSYVKASLAPGSRVVTQYLNEAGLLTALEQFGFHVVGYGCTTCSGKSGPIEPALEQAVGDHGLVAVAVLSGNRNFEGRIHKSVRASYLCSPPLVVAFALVGRVDIDFDHDPLGHDRDGKPVYLRDIWPSEEEIAGTLTTSMRPAQFVANYSKITDGTPQWRALQAPKGNLFPWSSISTYIRKPPFFDAAFRDERRHAVGDLRKARVLCAFGDSLTTDHVTPSGEITLQTEAGQYLAAIGVAPEDFNAYTQRRGNHDVLARATFANPRIRNLLAPDTEGGVTQLFPEGQQASIYAAATRYRESGVPIIVLAGKDYGMGSSRDWAAKGPALLGVRAILAKNFERIHRANLVGLGIVPLTFETGQGWSELGLDGSEAFDIIGIEDALAGHVPVTVTATKTDQRYITFTARLALSSDAERALLRAGGLFPKMYDRFDVRTPIKTSRREAVS